MAGRWPGPHAVVQDRAEADRFRRLLLDAVESGEIFDEARGEPASWSSHSLTSFRWSQEWIQLKWPQWAGTTRRSGLETLVAITPRMVKAGAPDPPDDVADWLRSDGYIPGSAGWSSPPDWLPRWSLPLDEVTPRFLSNESSGPDRQLGTLISGQEIVVLRG